MTKQTGRQSHKDKILIALGRQSKMTCNQISAETGLHRSVVSSALAKMLKDKEPLISAEQTYQYSSCKTFVYSATDATLGNGRMTAAEMALMLDQKLLKVAATAPGKSGHTINVYAARTSASVAPGWIPKQEWFSALAAA